MPGDERDRATPQQPGPDPITATDGSTILAERQCRARSRIRAQNEHRRVCRQLEALVPLTRYYGPRPLRSVSLGRFLAEGWWAA